MYKNIILPASLLAGTVIGAGIFALPFVFVQAGVITGLFYLVIFCAVFILIHLMYAEVIMKTPAPVNNEHRFPGYAKIYLGQCGFWLAVFSAVLEMILILTIYLILSLSFLRLVLPSAAGFPDIFKILIFWFLGSAAIFLDVKKISFLEFLTNTSIALIVFLIFIFGAFHFDRIISFSAFDFKNIFLPYGVILFALNGRPAISTLVNYFRKINFPTSDIGNIGNIENIKKSIILGTSVPALIYLLFIFGILGFSSGAVSEDAISGIIANTSPLILALVGIFGLISLWDSYFIIGLDVKNSLRFDLKFPKILAGLAVIALPLILFLSGLQNFLSLVVVVGGIFIALEGILISLMWIKVSKKGIGELVFGKLNPILVYILILVFVGGMVYKLVY